MKIGWMVFALVAGILIPAQAAMNARMRVHVGSPFYSATINFVVGFMALLVLMGIFALRGESGEWRGALGAPWWGWCGGLIGVTMVVSGVLVVPRMGAALFTASIMVGQVIGALLLDHYGFFGLPQRAISGSRLLGGLFLLLGIWFVQRK